MVARAKLVWRKCGNSSKDKVRRILADNLRIINRFQQDPRGLPGDLRQLKSLSPPSRIPPGSSPLTRLSRFAPVFGLRRRVSTWMLSARGR